MRIRRLRLSNFRSVGNGLILFPGHTVTTALPHIDALRRAIGERRFSIRSPERPKKKPSKPTAAKRATPLARLTVSIGVAGPGPRLTDSHEVLRAADKALYRAKKTGRNRVVGK